MRLIDSDGTDTRKTDDASFDIVLRGRVMVDRPCSDELTVRLRGDRRQREPQGRGGYREGLAAAATGGVERLSLDRWEDVAHPRDHESIVGSDGDFWPELEGGRVSTDGELGSELVSEGVETLS